MTTEHLIMNSKLLSLLCAALPLAGVAQIDYNGRVYRQDFDTLSSGTVYNLQHRDGRDRQSSVLSVEIAVNKEPRVGATRLPWVDRPAYVSQRWMRCGTDGRPASSLILVVPRTAA